MIEKWYQWTCDGCGDTENTPLPNTPMKEVRQNLKDSGWVCLPGGLDYCQHCVLRGKHTRRFSLFDPNSETKESIVFGDCDDYG